MIGTGGMGRVVAARDEAGKPIAIKLLLSPPSERVWVERFFREARAVSRINSAHVVKVVAVSSAKEETPFIVMERLRGRDYGKRLRAEGPLTLRDVADAVVQACDALACSHNVGVVHRDVKPSNLFDHANPDGTRTLKVLDFGISKARGQEEFEHTLTTSRDGMLGSPPYMSPEHIRDARSVDHRTDIWSLGVVAYQLLAARLPFDGQSVGEVFCSVLERRFSPLSKVRPELPREVEAIINRCLAREPGDRYQTAAELAKAFAAFASPGIAALVSRMPSGVPAPVSGPSRSDRVSPLPGMSKRLDGELHTITLPPLAPADAVSTASDEAAPTEPTIVPITPARLGRIDPIINVPPAPKLLHYDDLSAASIEAAKRMRRPKRSVALAAGVAVVMFGLMAVPFLLSGASNAKPAAATQLAPAVALPAPAPPAEPKKVATPTAVASPAVAPLSPAKASHATAVGRDEVTFAAPAPSARSAPAQTRTTTRGTQRKPAAARPPAHVPEVKAAEPKPEPKPPKPESRELHPNPYDQ